MSKNQRIHQQGIHMSHINKSADIFQANLSPLDYQLLPNDRIALEQFLDYHRNNLLAIIHDLTPAEMCLASVPPSNLTLIGLVSHLTDVESYWFYRIATGTEPYFEFYTPENPDKDLIEHTPDTVRTDIVRYEEMLGNVREICQKINDLDAPVAGKAWRKYPTNLRWIYLHMIEEYARHLGHADLIRECIDGAKGIEPPLNISE